MVNVHALVRKDGLLKYIRTRIRAAVRTILQSLHAFAMVNALALLRKDVPAGASPRSVGLTNLTAANFDTERPIGTFRLSSPEPTITAVQWCSGAECAPVATQAITASEEEAHEDARMILPLLEIETNELVRQRTIRKIGAGLRDIAVLLATADGAPEATDAQKEKFARISAAVDEGLLVQMDREALDAGRRHTPAFSFSDKRRYLDQ
jgi:hypothetical protein